MKRANAAALKHGPLSLDEGDRRDLASLGVGEIVAQRATEQGFGLLDRRGDGGDRTSQLEAVAGVRSFV